jgi:flavin reductase (DIM6/NTAB) family NADH-FMN oxidoreductase RutF
MSDDAFEQICRPLDFPMAIVTAFDGRERSGCLVGFHTQCSISPPRWLVCLSKTNHTLGVAAGATRLAVHLLHADQRDLALLFGASSADEIGCEGKFARCGWRADAHGTPILDGCDWIAGTIVERIDVGDHIAHVLAITVSESVHGSAPQLGFQAVNDIRPGHEP